MHTVRMLCTIYLYAYTLDSFIDMYYLLSPWIINPFGLLWAQSPPRIVRDADVELRV